MSNMIKECEELVSVGSPNEFNEADDTVVEETPGKVVEWSSVSLWGQHLGTGDKRVNMRAPALVNWLKRLAASCIGESSEYDDIRYKFVSSKLLPLASDHGRGILTDEPTPDKSSGTTTPISSL